MRQAGKARVIMLRDLATTRQKTVQLRELGKSQRRLDIRHAVVEAEHVLLLQPRLRLAGVAPFIADEAGLIAFNPMTSQEAQTTRQFHVVGDHRAPLTGGDGFHRMEREYTHLRIYAAPDRAAANITAAYRMRSIFNDDPIAGPPPQISKLCRAAGQMPRNA